MASSSLAEAPLVAVIADNPETGDGLCAYLSAAGLAAGTTCSLRELRLLPDATSAAVLFPDEFGADEVTASVLAARGAHPRLLIVLVTSAPQDFVTALRPDGRSLSPVTLPKPAFGWTILDTLRAHANPESS